MTPVRVVIPARDAAATLPATLDALAAQDLGERFEVVVADNGSRDATAEIASAHPAVDAVVRLPRGGGADAARNAGAAGARAEVLAFTDADCVPTPAWLAAGVAALAEADLVQGRVDPDPHAPRGPWDRTLSVTAAWGLFESANLFVRRDWFERLGGFPAGIFDPGNHLAEDVFFGWSARRAGARTGFCAEALVHHAVFPRGPRGFIAERRRLRHFPEIARRAPEIRDTFLRSRVFLTPQSRAFDAAVAGAAAGALSRSPLPLLAALPYGVRVARAVRTWPQYPGVVVAAVTVAADAVGAAALVRGSIEQRTPVL